MNYRIKAENRYDGETRKTYDVIHGGVVIGSIQATLRVIDDTTAPYRYHVFVQATLRGVRVFAEQNGSFLIGSVDARWEQSSLISKAKDALARRNI